MKRNKPSLIRGIQMNPDGSTAMRTMRADEIKLNDTPCHATLPTSVRIRAKAAYDRVGKVLMHPMSLSAWLDGFRYDHNPGSEVAVWEQIAAAFEHLGGPALPRAAQTKLARAINNVSVGVVDVESQTGFDSDGVIEIREAYKAAALDYEAIRPGTSSGRRLIECMQVPCWQEIDAPETHAISNAEIVFGHDVFSNRKTIFHGEDLVREMAAGIGGVETSTISISLDFDNEKEVSAVTAAIIVLHGFTDDAASDCA
jgi:hypothetical protein